MGCSKAETVEIRPVQKNMESEITVLPNYEEKVNDFIKQKLKDSLDYEYRNISDRNNNPYFKLRKLEIKKLEKKFLSNNFIFEETLRNILQLNLYLDQNLINDIIKKENVGNIYTEKIINKINEFKNDKDKFKIEYLTVLLVRKRKIGKKKLIKYMLQLNDGKPNETYNFFRK